MKKERFELKEKGTPWEGWRSFDGYGKLEGYQWAEADINIREYEGNLQSVAIQKMYLSLIIVCMCRQYKRYRLSPVYWFVIIL